MAVPLQVQIFDRAAQGTEPGVHNGAGDIEEDIKHYI